MTTQLDDIDELVRATLARRVRWLSWELGAEADELEDMGEPRRARDLRGVVDEIQRILKAEGFEPAPGLCERFRGWLARKWTRIRGSDQ